MPVDPRSPARLLDTVISKANALRAAGVTFVELDGLKFGLSLPEQVDPRGSNEGPAQVPVDPLQDPALYPGGIVPGFGPPAGYED